MSVINRMEVSNCINLDNFQPNQKDWSPHYPYLELNFRGLSAAVKATNGTGKTTINNAYYALTTRDRSMTSKFKSRMAPKRKGVWSHFRLELLYQSPEDNLRGQQLFGPDIPGEAWVFGMYGYSDDAVHFYFYRGHFEDCPLASKEGHSSSLIHNETFIATLKAQTNARTSFTVSDWIKAIGRHMDINMNRKMLAYHKAGGGDGTENFFKVDPRPGEKHDTSFFYNHIAPETLVDCMGSYADEDEYGFEDTLLKSAQEIIKAKYEVNKSGKKISKLSGTFDMLSAAKNCAEDHNSAQENLQREATEVLAEYQFLRQCVIEDPLPLLPVVMTQNHPQTRLVANGMIVQDGEWLFPDYVLSEITGSESKKINQFADRNKLASATIKRAQVIEIPCDLDIKGHRLDGHPNRAYSYKEALHICQESPKFAEGWSKDAALRAINYAWSWRTGEGEHNIFRTLQKEADADIETLGQQIASDEARWEEKNNELQRLNSEIQGIEQADQALSDMRQSQLFSAGELAEPSATGRAVELKLQQARQALKTLEDQYVALEDRRQSYARVTQEFAPKFPAEVREYLETGLASAKKAVTDATLEHENGKDRENQARHAHSAAQETLSGLRSQKGDIDLLVPDMQKYESLFPGEDPLVLVESVPQALNNAKNRKIKVEHEIKQAEDLGRQFGQLASGISTYRTVFNDEPPQGLTEKVTRALSDAEHEIDKLTEQREQARNKEAELTKGQQHLADVVSRFGEGVNVGSLETELENREKEITETLNTVAQTINRLSPVVEALEVFEQRYPGASPADIQQQRKKRSNEVAVEINDLVDRLRITRRQIEGLESGGSAAGRIGSEVLECVGGTPLLVHQAIKDMALPAERESAVMTHFSHVLHSPVYGDADDAGQALTRLDEAGIEAPVFSLEGLQDFCRTGNLVTKEGSVRGLLAGMDTLQVKALLDPSRVPTLIQELQKNATEIENKLVPLHEESNDLASDSDTSRTIALACQAVDEGARPELGTAREQHHFARDELKTIQAQRAPNIIQGIRQAVSYVEAGGDLALNQQKADIARFSQILDERNLELPELKVRASEKALSAIQVMQKFLDLGGDEGREQNSQMLAISRQSLNDINEKLPVLQRRNDQFPVIDRARQFIELGGWEKARFLENQLTEATLALDSARQAETDAREHVEQAAARVDSAKDLELEAAKNESFWKSDLQRAIDFENENGVSFDATYQEKRDTFQQSITDASQRSRYQFDLAQRAVDAENDPFFHDNKLKQRDDLSGLLKVLRQQITDNREDQEDARKKIPALQQATNKTDVAARVILGQWKTVHKITRDLPADQRGAAPKGNMFVDDSRQIAMTLRDACAEKQWEEALEALDGIAENTQSFPLSERQQKIQSLDRARQRALGSLKKEVGIILSVPDNGLSESEAEALSTPHSDIDLTQSILSLHRLIEDHLVKAENKHRLSKQDVEINRQRMLDSMAGFTGNAQDNFDLLKRAMSSRNGGASIKVSGTVIGVEGMKATLESLVDEIDTQFNRRQEDRASERVVRESDQAFNERLRKMIRSEFYRAAFRAPESSDASGPRVFFNHPQIGGGRDIPLSKDVSTGQYNALMLLILVKLADFSMRRDARNEYNEVAMTRAKKLPSARTVMIDGLFSNLSNKKMIRESLSVLRSLKGSFQLIGWIHNQQYDNDYELFPGCITIRRTGLRQGFVLADDIAAPPLAETKEVAAIETHITAMAPGGDQR